jgi:hypothetical protein
MFVFIGGLILRVEAATLYLMPQSQTVYKGDPFIIDVQLDTESAEINTVGASLNLPSDLFEVIDFNKGDSLLTFWPEEPKLEGNTVSFIGGIPGGFLGKGSVLKINLRAKELGQATISFGNDSKVLLNDGQGTAANLNFLEGNYEISPKPEGLPVVSSATHPDQNKWYRDSTFKLHWDLVQGAEYSYTLSRDPLAEPDDVPDKPEGELIWMGDMEYANLEDGIYYFHLKQKLPEKDWSSKVTYLALIDTTLPELFGLYTGQDPSMFNGRYFLSFSAIDKTSGIDHYEIKEGKKDFKEVKSPYLLTDQNLTSKIIVKAIDKAGNERVSEMAPLKKAFPYWEIVVAIVVIVLVLSIVIIIKIKRRKNR